ncbi:MAG: hypothetical protein NZZ41_02815 [Candidatus Dojkabacteria bacterium]|nr:hypothetical protein [Candidatus Dojkabacteria bacterium]
MVHTTVGTIEQLYNGKPFQSFTEAHTSENEKSYVNVNDFYEMNNIIVSDKL